MAYRLRVPSKLPPLGERGSGLRSMYQPIGISSVTSTRNLGAQKYHIRLSTTATASAIAAPLGQDTSPVKQASAMASLPLTWPHKGWDEKVVLEVVPSHRKPRNMSDRVALRVIKLCRWAMDLVTGMPPEPKAGDKVTTYQPMTESQWLVRFIFLETIAGIPGAIAGTLRHLASIRRFQLDQGWIKTLLEESYNERMHLLTFLELYRPGRVMRFMVWAAQGVFYNTMFVTYLVSPSFCHRFVGYLEDEAVGTYTKCLEEMDKGRLKGWTEEGFRIPEIAVRYWNMPEGKRTMRDLILYIRADEASHRGVNHTLGNLDQTSDPNPFMDEMSNKSHMQLAATKPAGLEREEVLKKYAR